MAPIDSDRLYGTLNLLILRTLQHEARHGLGILRAIEAAALSGMRIEEGALYPALHRLERDGFIRGTWGLSETNRRAKFYEVTSKGAQRCEQELERWLHHTVTVARVLQLDLAAACAG